MPILKLMKQRDLIMKYPLVAWSLLGSFSLIANTCEDPPHTKCCETVAPCCCEYEGYKPAFYCLEGDCGFYFDAEFLYWYARETNLPYAAEMLAKIAGSNISQQDEIVFAQCLQSVGSAWDYGGRVGVGWSDKCDGWDGSLNWTYFENCEKDNSSTPEFSGRMPMELGQSALLNPFPQRSVTENPFFERMRASWRIRFNQIDLELGRKYLVSSSFVMRPYIGLRGAWTKTNFKVSGDSGPKNLSTVTTNYTQKSRDHFTNRIWGVGLMGGFQPTWYFCSCIALYGNFGGALIWGEHEEKKTERFDERFFNTESSTEDVLVDTFNRFSEDCNQMSAIFDLAIGLRWEMPWCCNRFMTTLDVGWEHHVWFAHSYRLRTYDRFGNIPQFNQFDLQVSDLGYGGLVARFRLDF